MKRATTHCLLWSTLVLGTQAFFAGCFSLTNLQTPEVLKEGEYSGGFGLYPNRMKLMIDKFNIEYVAGGVQSSGRIGLGNNFDVGAKIFGLPYFIAGGVAADIKYQIIDDPLFVSTYQEISYSTHKAEKIPFGTFLLPWDKQTYRDIYGFNPCLMVGMKHLYGGVKIFNLYSPGRGYVNINSLFLGAAFELNWFRATLEIGKYSPVNNSIVTLVAAGFDIKLSQLF